MYQRIILAGNLGTDPEMRIMPDGTPFTRFSLATDSKWKTGKQTTWWRITTWNKQAEVVAEYMSKGRAVIVEGRMEPDPETGNPRMYERNDGSIGTSYEVRADVVRFLSSGDMAEPEKEQPKEESQSQGIPF